MKLKDILFLEQLISIGVPSIETIEGESYVETIKRAFGVNKKQAEQWIRNKNIKIFYKADSYLVIGVKKRRVVLLGVKPGPYKIDSLREILGYLQICGLSEAELGTTQKLLTSHIEEAERKVAKDIKEVENPYPSKMFTPITSEEWDKIDKLLTKHMGFRIDRVSGNLCRKGFEVFRRQALEQLNSKGGSDV